MLKTKAARAPGKIVLSGAYAVLAGAPAIVTAVDRYAFARTDSPPLFHSHEVDAALADLEASGGPARELTHPYVDASALREGTGESSRKLGLGSSAAILVSCLAVLLAQLRDAEPPLDEIWRRALTAHRKAQGGGSGVDVDAATYGGTRVFQRKNGEPSSYEVVLPRDLTLEVWSVSKPASTGEFISKVWALTETNLAAFESTLGAQSRASSEAEKALKVGSATGFISALAAQSRILEELGILAGIPILLPELGPLRATLSSECAWLPAGAGGGDIMLYAGLDASPASFRKAAQTLKLSELKLGMGAVGVELL